MKQPLQILRRRKPKHRGPVLRAAFERPAQGGALAAEYPGYTVPDDSNRRTVVTGGLAALFHFGLLGVLILFASLAPVVTKEVLPVQLLKEEPEPQQKQEEPAPAPKALAERRALPFNPAVQTVNPQIVNPRVIAEASPAIQADALKMDAVTSVAAPTQIQQQTTVVEHVSAVSSIAHARAAAVDVQGVAGPAVRGPVVVNAPVGASVGPRAVQVSNAAPSFGTGKMQIGTPGSSVKEGVLSNRDVVGSPDGALVVSVDTAVGDGYLRGAGGTGTGNGVVSQKECMQKPEVQDYLLQVKSRTLQRWQLPPGVDAGRRVTLRFRLDVAGSASNVAVERADDNALGASAVDALRAASPFPPMPDDVRCLSLVPIVGTFSNPVSS
ncbi:MAG TPA: TonB family protein [Myxococcota bacterium]|nr:TonB family protein [Myxococcota bacterium]